MRKFALLAVLMCSTYVFGSHIVGADVSYRYIGGDQYEITWEVFRDCDGIPLDYPLSYTVFNNLTGTFVEYSLYPETDFIPVDYDIPCIIAPGNFCVQRGTYIDTIALQPAAQGYYITYQRCCWSGAITNLLDSQSWGLTITTDIPGSALVNVPNNSAQFNELPAVVLCSSVPYEINCSASDVDGDSLAYSLCAPLTISDIASGGGTVNPEYPKPYQESTWDNGFSTSQPFGPGSSTTIDPQTGILSITPSVTGIFAVAVCIEEWRDGVLINVKSRTLAHHVVSCQITDPTQIEFQGPEVMTEGCSSYMLAISRDDASTTDTIHLLIGGSAINGTDYSVLPDDWIFEAGELNDTIWITPYFDGIIEGTETIELEVYFEDICTGEINTFSLSIDILDYIDMTVTAIDSLNICDETENFAELWCIVENGLPPYSFIWSPMPTSNNDTNWVDVSYIEDNPTTYNVTIEDQCGQSIQSDAIVVYNQCPLVAPNIITANNDGINDVFIVKNREDYESIALTVVNRWGNTVYSSDDYQNDWSGLDKSGKPLTEGVYFYTIVPESEKYEYDDQKKTIFTLHGFFYIVK